jgi:alpha-1,6-mannosyltransferase
MRAPTVRPLPLTTSSRRAIWVFVIGMAAVGLVAATPGSPYPAVLPQGQEPGGPFRWISDLLFLQQLGQFGLVFMGTAALVATAAGFLMILREAWQGRLPMRTAMLLAIGANLVVLTLPLLFSRDVYSYAFYGRIFNTYGANPYSATPADFDLNSMFDVTWPGWRSTPSVYGPLFTWFSVALTAIPKSIPWVTNAFQLSAAAAVVGTTWIVARTVRQVRPDRAVFAAVLVGVNPLVVLHVTGGGHNDAFVALFVAAAVWYLFRRREMAAAIALGLAMSIKVSAIVPLALLLVAVIAATPRERRLRTFGVMGGTVAAVWLVLAIPFLDGRNWTLGLTQVAGNDSWMSAGQSVVRAFSGLGGMIGGEMARAPAQAFARIVLVAVATVAVIAIARRVWRDPAARTPEALAAAWGWAFLAILLTSPVLYTWYLVWVLPVAWLLPRVPRRALIVLSTVLLASQLVTESTQIPASLQHVNLAYGHPVTILVAIWVGRDFVRRIVRGIPLHAETLDPVFGDAFEREAPAVAPAPVRTPVGAQPVASMRRR